MILYSHEIKGEKKISNFFFLLSFLITKRDLKFMLLCAFEEYTLASAFYCAQTNAQIHLTTRIDKT